MFYTAERIHNGNCWLPEGSSVEFDESGTLLSVQEFVPAGASYLDGVLCPGFVNTHCHLELSHLKGAIPEGTGLMGFLRSVPSLRAKFTDDEKRIARLAAFEELFKEGVVAVGDIANSADTVDLRAMGRLNVHTFVESIGFSDANAGRSFDWAKGIYDIFSGQGNTASYLGQSIVPHAPYSVSKTLFGKINDFRKDSIVSIHNQESIDENDFYERGVGGITGLLGGMNIDYSGFQPTGNTSIRSYSEWLDPKHQMLFVHNVVTSKKEVVEATELFSNSYWCLCPNANLYIHGVLPNVEMLVDAGANICIGTDSLASNHRLSILDELITLKKHFAWLPWVQLLTWATSNGAKALGMSHIVGTLTAETKPGLLQLTGLEGEYSNTKLRRIV